MNLSAGCRQIDRPASGLLHAPAEDRARSPATESEIACRRAARRRGSRGGQSVDARPSTPAGSRRGRARHVGAREKLPMPGSRASRAAHLRPVRARPRRTSMRPMTAHVSTTSRSASDRPDRPHERVDEPRPVPALQRQLAVVDDDGGHRRLCDCRLHRLSASRQAAASAARWPLRTAPSIVPGRPVSVQSPAR